MAGAVASSITVLAIARALGVDEIEALNRAGYAAGLEDQKLPLALRHFPMLQLEDQKTIINLIEFLYQRDQQQ